MFNSACSLLSILPQVDQLEAKKHTLELACRELDVRLAEKRDNIGDALSNDSDEVLQKNLREFDINFNNLVSVTGVDNFLNFMS